MALFVVLMGLVGMALSFPRPDDPYHKPVYHEPSHKGRVKMQVRHDKNTIVFKVDKSISF